MFPGLQKLEDLRRRTSSATGMAATTWRTTAYMVSGSIILNFKSSVIPLIVKRIAKEQTSGKVKSDRSYNVICFVCSCGNYEKTAQNHQGMATNRKEGE